MLFSRHAKAGTRKPCCRRTIYTIQSSHPHGPNLLDIAMLREPAPSHRYARNPQGRCCCVSRDHCDEATSQHSNGLQGKVNLTVKRRPRLRVPPFRSNESYSCFIHHTHPSAVSLGVRCRIRSHLNLQAPDPLNRPYYDATALIQFHLLTATVCESSKPSLGVAKCPLIAKGDRMEESTLDTRRTDGSRAPTAKARLLIAQLTGIVDFSNIHYLRCETTLTQPTINHHPPPANYVVANTTVRRPQTMVK